MNEAATIRPPISLDKPLTIAILAMGGQGGGVLADWVVEVAEAAVLCPSFYRTEVIFNPSRWDRRLAGLRERVIGWLQRRRESRRIAFA